MPTAPAPLTPREIVRELDRAIVGQAKAKRACAVALRNRWRRQQLPEALRDEVNPKNIMLIGPTGVGKTEIARRLAKLVKAPFVKCEATKFSETGYVGRDVDSMMRDLVEVAIADVRREHEEQVNAKARQAALDRVVELLRATARSAESETTSRRDGAPFGELLGDDAQTSEGKAKLREQVAAGRLDHREVELDVQDKSSPFAEIFSNAGMEEIAIRMEQLGGTNLPFGPKSRKRRVKVAEALTLLTAEEAAKLVDVDAVKREALQRAENDGIIFIDEIDKIANRGGGGGHGPDVSREGVQRDLLPLVEGTTVNTKHGVVSTRHVLFVAAGAFHVSKPSDLIPELQGRFPIRVELEALTKGDFVRILTEPEASLTRQYKAMIATEGVEIEFLPEAVDAIADFAHQINQRGQNIGARRLYTVLERVLEEVSFEAPDMGSGHIPITAEYVRKRLADVAADEDLSRYIL